jgi:hypothetical protein
MNVSVDSLPSTRKFPLSKTFKARSATATRLYIRNLISSIMSTIPLSSLCDNPSTPYHTLSCGHTILPSPSSTVSTTSKSPCSPNCHRAIYILKPQLPFSWLKNTSPEPFICPKCVEECVRADYDILLRRQREQGGRIANQKEVNVGI